MVTTPSLREMLKAGAHFGHKTSRWNPNMAEFIFTAKSGVHVINLEETEKKLKQAVQFLSGMAAEGKMAVFVGTKKQAGAIVEKAARECEMPFVNSRWLGGTLTNFAIIRSSVDRFLTDQAKLRGENADLSKRDLAKLKERVIKGEKVLGGLAAMTKVPDVLILIGAHDEKNALAEARAAGVPIVAITDTNTNPKLVDYPVPANDDATKSIELFTGIFAAAINEGRASKKE